MNDMKSVWSVLAATLLLIAAVPAGVAADPPGPEVATTGGTTADGTTSATEAIWLVDDFEDGLDAGWTDLPGTDVTSIDTIGAAGTGHSLRIDGGTGSYSGLWYDLGGWQPTGISFYVRSGDTSASDAYVVLGDDNVPSNHGAIFFYASYTGNLQVVTNGGLNYNLAPYAANTWYDIDFVVDWACNAFDVYVDGSLEQYNLPFRNPVSSFSRMYVQNFHSSTAWWDQFVMSTPPPSLLLFTDDFERASTCRWSSAVP